MAIAIAAALTCLPAGARAQLVGKIPPAPAATPEFKPPAPAAAPPPPKPSEPEKPLPTLVVKGADGKIQRYPAGSELAAVTAFGFDPETTRKIAASRALRAADVERMVIDKLPQVIEARKTRGKLDAITDVGEFSRVKDVAAPLAVEKLTDRLLRDGAISPVQRSRIEQVVKSYEDELKQEWQGQTGTDVLKILNVVAKEKFNEVTRDALEAYDALLLKAAPVILAEADDLNLTPEQRKTLTEASAQSADALAVLVASLDVETQKMLLSKAAAPK